MKSRNSYRVWVDHEECKNAEDFATPDYTVKGFDVPSAAVYLMEQYDPCSFDDEAKLIIHCIDDDTWHNVYMQNEGWAVSGNLPTTLEKVLAEFSEAGE